ncbi:MAG: ATP-binding cassette domain-containing protein, partial [bacterium]
LISFSSGEYKISDLNFQLKDGSIHAIVGKNGSNLEKLIHCMVGLEDIAAGEVRFRGQNINNHFKKEKNLNDINEISFLVKENHLIKHFSIAENLSVLNYPLKNTLPVISWKKIKEKADRVLKKLNFDLDYKTKINELSSEDRKKVAIAKLFTEDPDLIIMYEATETLGSECVSNLFRIIRDYSRNGGSVIYASKHWEEALKVADKISVLSEGVIRGTFTSETIKNNPSKVLNILENYNFKENYNEIDNESKEILNTVFKAAEYLTSEYELKDVLLLLAQQVTKVMNADDCIIDLIDDGTVSIIDKFEYKKEDNIEVALREETVLKLAQNNDIYYSTSKEKGFNLLFEKNNNVKTVICIPVLIRSRITGIIQIFYQELYVYSEDEAKYLSTFARHAALAIEDTRLMGRSTLLQESHHRIKNNLQSIISLISLQKKLLHKNNDKTIEEVLKDITSRIKSIAAVHDLLSRDKLGRSIINLKEIIKVIIKFINIGQEIEINLDLEDILIPYNRASSIALITNELVLNCIKHAFPEGQNGKINIINTRKDKSVLLVIEDTGRGLPSNFSLDNIDSLGLTIVKSIISKELKGEMKLVPVNSEGGTRAEIILPLDKVYLGQKN